MNGNLGIMAGLIQQAEPEKPFYKWDREQYHHDLIEFLKKHKIVVECDGVIVQCAKQVAYEAGMAEIESRKSYDVVELERINKELNKVIVENERKFETVAASFREQETQIKNLRKKLADLRKRC